MAKRILRTKIISTNQKSKCDLYSHIPPFSPLFPVSLLIWVGLRLRKVKVGLGNAEVCNTEKEDPLIWNQVKFETKFDYGFYLVSFIRVSDVEMSEVVYKGEREQSITCAPPPKNETSWKIIQQVDKEAPWENWETNLQDFWRFKIWKIFFKIFLLVDLNFKFVYPLPPEKT